MKRKQSTKLLICLASALASGPAFAQAGLPTQLLPGQESSGITQQEVRPTPRAPQYVPPVLPDYMRKKLDPSAEFLVSPAGGMDMEQFLRARALMEAQKKLRANRYDGRDFSDSADTPADRARFERDILRQFGVDLLPYRGREEQHAESPVRRFQIVFCLSMPFTLAFTYGIVAAANGSLGSSAVLNGPQTAGFISSGLILSGLIGWYDNVQWNKLRGKGNARDSLFDGARDSLFSAAGAAGDSDAAGDSPFGAAGAANPLFNPAGAAGALARHRAGLLPDETPSRRLEDRDFPLLQFASTVRF